MGEQLRLMAVHAHPDDESSKGAATMARYVAEGARVLVVSCTGGERGDVLNPRLQDDPEVVRDIVGYRRKEMAEAVRILGVEHRWLGFVDSGLPEGDPLPPLPDGCFALEPLEIAAAPLVRLVREFKPHVVTTYDENGGYPHPDHIMCHKVSMEAFEAAGDADRYVGHGEVPWQPLKLYYNQTFSKAKILTYHQALLDAGAESPFAEWMERWEDRDERAVTTKVPVAGYLDAADAALRAHATQVDPDGMWFSVPAETRRQVWPTEEFELARSHVGGPVAVPGATTAPDDVEDDLFAGVREHLAAQDRR
ncbi:mycothiol conjugate amidase Mca [Jannaschia sp. R86511]|uniref:mycothiol conjugate amidase Mca n=1 Tax=Jannaschia sp. R86511 TaxID=3093853 RepID=UPI0036D2754D